MTTAINVLDFTDRMDNEATDTTYRYTHPFSGVQVNTARAGSSGAYGPSTRGSPGPSTSSCGS